ncbi:glycerophosphoryl diester phosphodiesterase [Arenicella xantha]|uniref:glycerophosphodiester phosphodiesterase n=2 Tax=Arenicella xantha TaxID=644221 RepID=A0A395JIB0_9GAMM|nr:glycerophosphoryl diester phosphodiesterase [Arenicella xantha]
MLSMLLSSPTMADPLVIAHRGASGYLPEHTLEAITLAFAQGADYIEQDVVLSRDGVPVVLHDIHLDTVTDVAEKFPKKKRADGRFYAIDLTLAELKSLTVNERRELNGDQVFPGRYQGSAGFTIATFEEQIELIGELNRQFSKNVGLYPEIKSPAWHRAQGADISVVVLEVLRRHGLDSADARIYLQCFDFAETQRVRVELGAKLKLIQLIGENDWSESDSDYDYLKTPSGLSEVAKVAQGVGVWIPQLASPSTFKPTALAKHAQMAGLDVHAYTFRKDALPPSVTSPMLLDLLFKQLGINGIFTDFPDLVVEYLAGG